MEVPPTHCRPFCSRTAARNFTDSRLLFSLLAYAIVVSAGCLRSDQAAERRANSRQPAKGDGEVWDRAKQQLKSMAGDHSKHHRCRFPGDYETFVIGALLNYGA